MPFGIELKNKDGYTYYGEGETVMLYHGKVSHTVNHTHDGIAQVDIVPVFNIPSSKRVVVCSRTDTEVATCHELAVSGGKWVMRIGRYSDSTNGLHEFFVFIEVGEVSVPPAGVVVYSNGGTPVFHSGRPMLQIVDYAPIPQFMSGSSTLFPHKVANMPNITFSGRLGWGAPTTVVCAICQGNKFHQIGVINGGFSGGGTQNVNTVAGIINADFYSQFSNLPSY